MKTFHSVLGPAVVALLVACPALASAQGEDDPNIVIEGAEEVPGDAPGADGAGRAGGAGGAGAGGSAGAVRPAGGAAVDGTLEQRVAALEAELAAVREAVREEDDDDDAFDLQFQLRGGWFHLAHNHRDDVFAPDTQQRGWMAGIGMVMPIDRDMGPVDLFGFIHLEYRQMGTGEDFRSPATGQRGTISYINLVGGPQLAFPVSETITPYVQTGVNLMTRSHPSEAFTHLDLGGVLGAGVDIAVHDHASFGLEYRYTWFGVADLEDEDYGQLAAYLGLDF